MAKAKSKDDLSDLIGSSKGKKGKPEKKAKSKTDKPEKKAKKNGERKERGEGKFYFPKGDGTERAKLAAGILKRLKEKTSCKEFASEYDMPTWKVRLAAKDLWRSKKIKLAKSSGENGIVVMVPK